MKTIFFIITSILIYHCCQAQKTSQTIKPTNPNSNSSVPVFIGGNDSLISMLAALAKQSAEEHGVDAGKYEYKISIKIETDSSVSEHILRKDDLHLGGLVMGYLELQINTGRWKFIPATENGKPIAKTIDLTIPFEVTEQ